MMQEQKSEKRLEMIFSSDPAAGAINRSADGSSFEVMLPRTIDFSEYKTCSVLSSSIWWTMPNIAPALLNSNLYIEYPVATPYTLAIPKGLYDLSALNSTLSRLFGDNGLPTDLFTLGPDIATQKVVITANYTGVKIDFTQADTPRLILGFDSQILTSVSIGETFIADNTAAFNTINSFLITSSVVGSGIWLNGLQGQILTNVLINVAPGSQNNYEPRNPIRFSDDFPRTSRLQFALRDQNLKAVDTNSEYWSLRICFYG